MSPLRVLHVNTTDESGGAARAAHRIHLALRRIGVDSHMLVMEGRETDPYILQPLTRVQRGLHRIKVAASNRLLAQQVTPTNPVFRSLNWFSNGLADWINRSDFDIVNLHWLGGEMLSVEEIGRIKKPIFWTMHDMWPFSGAEHYDDIEHPGRYRGAYNATNRPAGYSGPDLDAWVWRRKQKAWADQRFHLISPSRWLANCAAESALMGHQPCSVIPNCIDTDVFKPIDRHMARNVLNLDPDKRYILFGAVSGIADRRKGFHLLQPALQQLATNTEIRRNTELLTFGVDTPALPPDFGLPVHYLGYFNDDTSLALLYSAADVFAAPSIQDNLPNTVVESLACGTPCVAFAVGGMVDLIENGINGFLAPPFSLESFSMGIRKALTISLPPVGVKQTTQSQRKSDQIAKSYQFLYVAVSTG